MSELEVAQLAIAICKAEVEKLIGPMLETIDGGSPWGRAFLLTMQELRSAEAATPEPTGQPGEPT